MPCERSGSFFNAFTCDFNFVRAELEKEMRESPVKEMTDIEKRKIFFRILRKQFINCCCKFSVLFSDSIPGIMRAQRNADSVIYVVPFGMVLHFFSNERYFT